MRATILLLCLTVILSGVFASNVIACTCGESTVAKHLMNARAVFLGEVVSKRRSNSVEKDGIEVTLKVERVWKGRLSEDVIVYAGATDDLYPFVNLCATPFKVGERYLVFAYGKEKLATDVCAGSAAFPYAERKIKQLGKGRPPLKTKRRKAAE